MEASRHEFSAKVRAVILVCNSIALIAFVAGLAWVVYIIAAMGAPIQITTLDRAGILDHEKLREAYPSLAVNPRHDIGIWVAARERRAAVIAASAGIAVSFVNICLILLLRPNKRRSANEDTGSP